MAESNGPLTLEGLAQILRGHMDWAAAQLAEERTERRTQDAQLREEIGTVAALITGLARIVSRHEDEITEHRRHLEEHRREIRQSYSRMEQYDARFEAISREIREMGRDIRRILDAMERRGGDGGSRAT